MQMIGAPAQYRGLIFEWNVDRRYALIAWQKEDL